MKLEFGDPSQGLDSRFCWGERLKVKMTTNATVQQTSDTVKTPLEVGGEFPVLQRWEISPKDISSIRLITRCLSYEMWKMDNCIDFLPTESRELYLHTLRTKFQASHVSNKSISLLAFEFPDFWKSLAKA